MKTSTMVLLLGGVAAAAGLAFLAFRVSTSTGSMVRVPASSLQSGGMTLDAVALATNLQPPGSAPLDVQIIRPTQPGEPGDLLGNVRLPGDSQLTAVTFQKSAIVGQSALARIA